MMNRTHQSSKQGGYLITSVLFFGLIAVILIGGIVNWAGTNIKGSRHLATKEQAFQIAEAGIEYYRWHLAHDQTDYQDGTATSGPYIHPYYDKEGIQIGNFSLEITPPATGTTVVTINSTGSVLTDPNKTRTIEARLAIPSLAKYAVAANDEMRLGEGTEVYGVIHSNDGIRFDGLAHNLVTSSKSDYDDPDHGGGNEFGVHTHVSPTDPLPPADVPTRQDVFEAGRNFPVPVIDFDGFTADLAEIKTLAQDDGHYFSGSGALGYNIVLKTDDTFDLYRVDSLVPRPTSACRSTGQDGWGTWSVNNETLLGNYSNPSNGVIFTEDDLWVEGQIDTARITIAAGRFPENPSTYASISFTEDILYTNYDGSDVLALMAQNNINAGMTSADTLRIDAALVAQKGRVGRYYYRPPFWFWDRCDPYHDRDTITLYGMIATNQRYGFAYTDGNGYDIRNIIYDANLLYSPPPSFPLTGDQYEVISWRELR